MLSIIIPTDIDEPNSLFQKTLQALSASEDLEIIFVSKSEGNTRAERLNIGFQKSKGEIVLFHHPRSFIEGKGIQYLINLSKEKNRNLIWGGFTHKFDTEHFLLRFTSWYSNQVRGKSKGIFYLDHCIFFDRELWKQNLPNVEIFEDTILSYYLLRFTKPILLPYVSCTSAIRFRQNGIWRQSFLNQLLKIGFHLKLNHKSMNQVYEKNLWLNDGNINYTNES